MSRFKTVFCAIIGLLWVTSVYSEDTLEIKTQETSAPEISAPAMGTAEVTAGGAKIKISANAWLGVGQIEKGFSTALGTDLDHSWIQQATGALKLETDFNERTRLVVEAEGDLLFSYLITLWNKEFVEDQKVTNFHFWLKQAEGTYTFGDAKSGTFPLQLGIGEFEYKYNPEVRNLGEYLFRASAYPVFFLNWFDGPFYRMAGLRATTQPVDWFKFDALLFSELYQEPLQDFSLAGVFNVSNPEIHLGDYTIGKAISFGGGVDLNRLFSVDNSKTTMKSGSRLVDNIYSLDTVGTDTAGKAIVDTGYYTFKSTKIAVRACIDPKAFFKLSLLGEEDLKIYAEYAILGLENYPAHNSPTGNDFYSKLSERTPIMVGFNFPAFKILDVLAIELEEYKSPYIPSSYNTFKQGLPTPVPANSLGKSVHDVKWSIYAKKRLGPILFVGQVARDHYQPGNNNVSYTERGDVLTSGSGGWKFPFPQGDWWWAAKVQFGY